MGPTIDQYVQIVLSPVTVSSYMEKILKHQIINITPYCDATAHYLLSQQDKGNLLLTKGDDVSQLWQEVR